MNLAEWLQRSARRSPNAPAILKGARVELDYAGFARRAASIGAGLRTKYGIAPGDRVALILPNGTDYLPLLYGIWFAGAAAVPINHKLHAREQAWIIANAEAEVVFTTDGDVRALAPLLSNGPSARLLSLGSRATVALFTHDPLHAPAVRERDDLAWLFYTSGTTGRPKGAMLSHGNLAAMALTYFSDVDDVRETDAALYAAPMSHGSGLYNLMHVVKGARHAVPESGGFDANEVLDLARRINHVSLFAAPTMVRRLVDAAKTRGSDGRGLKTIVYGGGPMYVADIEDAVATLGQRFVQIYGQGETPMTITVLPRRFVADREHARWRERLGSVGFAQSAVEVRIADPDGRTLPAGEVGEVLVRGPTVMLGYWKNPGATAAALRDGWLWTGDLGQMDADGFLTLKDRSKDVIISGGSNIYPREVEEVLLAHPRVREAAVIGRQDPEWGEIVVAYVAGEASAEELDALCLEQIARFKRPKDFVFVDTLPKNNYGKILKTELRERDLKR